MPNKIIGLKECKATVNGKYMSFSSKYYIYNRINEHWANQTPSKTGVFNFNCNLEHTDGNIPPYDKSSLK